MKSPKGLIDALGKPLGTSDLEAQLERAAPSGDAIIVPIDASQVSAMLSRFFDARTAVVSQMTAPAPGRPEDHLEDNGAGPASSEMTVPAMPGRHRYSVRALSEFNLASVESGQWGCYDEQERRFLLLNELAVMTLEQLLGTPVVIN